MKTEVFWDVMLCHWVYSPVELHHDRSVNPSDMTSHLKRSESSAVPLWEPQISCSRYGFSRPSCMVYFKIVSRIIWGGHILFLP